MFVPKREFDVWFTFCKTFIRSPSINCPAEGLLSKEDLQKLPKLYESREEAYDLRKSATNILFLEDLLTIEFLWNGQISERLSIQQKTFRKV